MARLPAFLALLLPLACSDGVSPGSVGWSCPNDNNCIAGLKCIDGKCAEPPGEDPVRPPPPDAGPVDAEAPVDAGVDAGNELPDAGPDDAGPVCPVPPELSQIQARIFGADNQPSCNQASCHSVQGNAGGLRLSTPLAQLHTALLGNTQDPAAPERKLVVPGNPAQSRLYVVIAERDPAGLGGPMPPNVMLNACDVESIRQWIADGAPAN